MKVIFYRLGERKIIEADNGGLWWEAHAGLGAVKRGKCFIRGDVLFIGHSDSEEPGLLKREFLESLQGIPQWEKTKYYCTNYSLHDCLSGNKMTGEETSEWAGNRSDPVRYNDSSQNSSGKPTLTQGPDPAAEASNKLGHYEITKKTDGQVWWKTYSGHGGLREGRCVIAGDILFMGSGETEERGNLKHAFLERLHQLPPWKTTRFYCPSCAIYDCRTGKNLVRGGEGELPGEAPSTSPEGIFTPPAGMTSSYPPSSRLRRTQSIDSFVSFLKKLAAKAGKGVERKPYWARLKDNRLLKSKIISSGAKAPKAPIHAHPIMRWIAYIGALLLIIGSLLLVLFLGLWKTGNGHHKNREHKANHHRDH